MAHLTCKTHGKRCMVLLPSKVVRHRSGNGECDSTEVCIAGKTIPANLISQSGVPQPIDRVAKRLGVVTREKAGKALAEWDDAKAKQKTKRG